MTFSIVAFDPDTGEVGVAVHSKVFSVGSIVPWAKADVGAVATQSMVNVSLGPIGLELLESGRTPDQVIEHFKIIDQSIERRQLGIVSVKHGAINFTGKECIPYAEGYAGINYSCQGNLLTGPEVIKAMSKAFENTTGYLADKMLASLQAGQKMGGDARGKQSAAIIIEQKGKGRVGYGSRKIDLRVEDHINPIEELIRIHNISKMNQSIYQAFVFDDRNKGIEYLINKIDENKDRIMDEAWLSLALLYYLNENRNESKNCIDICFQINPKMRNIFLQYPKLGLGFDEQFVKEIIESN